jgi:uncharacterized protein YdeI (BOF family)
MKALFITLFMAGITFGAMAQQKPGDNTRTVTFDSPAPTVKVNADAPATTAPADRVVFVSPEPTVKVTKSNNPAAVGAPRVEFTSPEPTVNTVTGKKDDE